MNNDEIKTSDFQLAIVFRISGFNLVRLESIPDEEKRKMFVFVGNKSLAENLEKSFWNKDLKVDCKTFFEAIDEIRTRLYGPKKRKPI